MLQPQKNVLFILLWLLLTSCMAGVLTYKVVSGSIVFDANILNILDLGEDIDDLTKAAVAPFETKALLLVQHPNKEITKARLTKLKNQLLQQSTVINATVEPSKNFDLQKLTKTYTQYPLAFLSKEALKARNAGDYSYIINNYMKLLSGPSNPLVSLTINEAPLLNLADWFADKLTHNNWKQDGQFIYAEYEDQRYYPLFLEFNRAATQMDTVVKTISQVNSILGEKMPDDMSIYTSGFIFHSAAITSRASYEMQLFGGISLLGVFLLTLLSFRSIQPLLCISLLIASASLAGMFALTLAFEKIHVLSLVFAISLIGIAVDYGYHILLTAKHTGLRNEKLIQYISPAIIVSGGTTLVSYLLLLFLPIQLLQQVAVFVASGLAFTIFTGLFLITNWPWNKKHSDIQGELQHKEHSPIKGFKFVLGLLIIMVIATLPNWQFQDDINVFNSSPAKLIANEKMINEIVGNQQYPRFIYTQANSIEQLVQQLEQLRETVKQLDSGKFELRGIDQWLPSIATQKANSAWLEAGLESQQLSPISKFMTPDSLTNLSEKSAFYMTLEQVPKEIIGLFPNISVKENQVIGILSYMGPIDDELLTKIKQQLNFPINYFDQPAKFTSALTKLRTYILYFLAAAVITLICLMMFRYGLLNGLKLASLPIMTAISSLVISHLLLSYVTIFNLLGCILIIALSVDYIVFLREHGRQTHVLKAISLSAATTGLAFGMFIFSSTPAILHFGLTILAGVIIAWILCLMLPTSFLQQTSIALE